MHSNRIATIMIDNASLTESNVIVKHNPNDYEVGMKSEEIPDMGNNSSALLQSNEDIINAIIKVSYEPKSNHITVDSSMMVRFMICMFLLKFNRADRKGMFRALAMWALSKFTSTSDNKL